jgi:integrase
VLRGVFHRVFPNALGKKINLRNWRRDHWQPALIGAGLVDDDGKAHRTPYALRHTFATNALRAGCPTFIVARRMGTGVPQIERTYGHHAEDSLEWGLSLLNGRHMDARVAEQPP